MQPKDAGEKQVSLSLHDPFYTCKGQQLIDAQWDHCIISNSVGPPFASENYRSAERI